MSSSHTQRTASLDDSVMRTVVSRGNDALNILFQAAAHQERTNGNNQKLAVPGRKSLQGSSSANRTQSRSLSWASPATIELWSACRFVAQGWMSAQEAITYVDLFFKNMCPLSPIINDFYRNHANHLQLLTEEPLLCGTILSISSRYHVLPGIGGTLRSALIHDRMWRYCQDLIRNTVFGQERGAKPMTRGVGTIEALLLVTEWHPRSLHFPPNDYGWDSELLINHTQPLEVSKYGDFEDTPANQWLEDVIEPARRSDRMSWMLLGNAVTLAHELGIFEEADSEDQDGTTVRRMRVRKLLYVYVNHLASRLGYVTLIPPSLNPIIDQSTASEDPATNEWQSHMASWILLTNFSKLIADEFFSSADHTRQILRSGHYIGMLERFLPRLDDWRRVNLEAHSYQGSYQETLFIEYHYVRIYVNSLGMQAACERAVMNKDEGVHQHRLTQPRVDNLEYGFIQEVIEASCEILRKVIRLAETDTLRFAPVRLFLRITTSSIFLLKALSLGVRNDQLQSALDVLDQTIQALKTSNLDEVHLAARYATLLETHVERLRQGFLANEKKRVTVGAPVEYASRAGEQTPIPNGSIPTMPTMNTNGVEAMEFSALDDLPDDNWLSLPFDPSMAPFAPIGSADIG